MERLVPSIYSRTAKAGIEVKAVIKDRTSAFHRAAMMVKCGQERGGNLGLMLRYPVPVGPPTSYGPKSPGKVTARHMATIRGNYEAVQLFLKGDTDPGHMGDDECTAMHWLSKRFRVSLLDITHGPAQRTLLSVMTEDKIISKDHSRNTAFDVAKQDQQSHDTKRVVPDLVIPTNAADN